MSPVLIGSLFLFPFFYLQEQCLDNSFILDPTKIERKIDRKIKTSQKINNYVSNKTFTVKLFLIYFQFSLKLLGNILRKFVFSVMILVFAFVNNQSKMLLKITKFLQLPVPPSGIYLIKVNSRNFKTRCEICSELTIKTPERRH